METTMARGKPQTEDPKDPAKVTSDPNQAAATEATVIDGSNSSKEPIEPSSKPAAKPKIELSERSFEVRSRLKRDGIRYTAGDKITLDRAGFEELKRFRVVDGAFDDGGPVKV
jgi:hypothetical protein